MHEPFDDELRERLRHYTEEPDRNLWQGIAPFIGSVNTEPVWSIWAIRISITLIGITALLVINLDNDGSLQSGLKQNSNYPAIESSEPALIEESTIVPFSHSVRASSESGINSTTGTIIEANDSLQPVVPLSNFQVGDEIPGAQVSIIVPEEFLLYDSIPTRGESTHKNWKDTVEVDFVAIMDSNEIMKPNRIKKKIYKKQRTFTLYLTAMPTFGYQRIESNNSDNIIIESINRVPAFSSERLGIRLETGMEVPINKRWKGFGGILYYQRKQTIGYIEKQVDSLIISPGPDGGIIIEPQFSYIPKSIEYELKNIGVQVGFSYRLWMQRQSILNRKEALASASIPLPKKKFLHVAGAGIEFHKALNKADVLQKAEGFNDPSMFVFLNLYYRLQYPSIGRLKGIFQPTLNYSFYINENLNAPFYVKPYGLGLNFGCVYNF